MIRPFPFILLLLALGGCQRPEGPGDELGQRAQLLEAGDGQRLLTLPGPALADTGERPRLRLLLQSEPGAKGVEVAAGVLDAALGPGGKVAFIDESGLHFWAGGRSRFIARAVPHGLAAGAAGVVFVSPAASGGGAGLSFIPWEGEPRPLIPAAEGLPGPAGFHHPALSPDGRYAVAFSNLTPRPSLWRVTLAGGEVTELSADAPAAAARPRWEGGLLVWADPDGRRASLEPASGRLELQ